MKLIQEQTLVRAWVAGAKHIQSTPNWDEFNLILAVADPTALGAVDKSNYEKMDAFLKSRHRSVHTVAETIFPASEYIRHGTRGVFEVYPNEVYPLIKKSNPWGTYAHRLVRHTKKGKTINPLEVVISRMRRELELKSKKRACYEISLTDVAADVPIFDNEKDIGRPMGGPCLSHVSFKLNPEEMKVHLTALYRSHYYVERALGNLVGLARLQAFFAKEVGAAPGELVCVSSYAKLDFGSKESPWKKTEIEALLDAMVAA
jgi:hypothetical protein